MSRHLSRWLLVGALLLATHVMAQASPPVPQTVSLGVSNLRTYSWYRPGVPTMSLDAAYMRAASVTGFGSHFFWGGGVRLSMPPAAAAFPIEAFVRAELRTRLGYWEPSGGLELGLSQIPAPWPVMRLSLAYEQFHQDDLLHGPAYMAVHAAPLRFHVGRFVLGGPEVQFGPVGPPVGTVIRIQVGLAHLEVQL